MKRWSKEELSKAARPVKKHLTGRGLTANRVLAAYFRAEQLSLTGATWDRAKRALNDTGSFKAAVEAAKESQTSPVTGVAKRDSVTAEGSPRWDAPAKPLRGKSTSLAWFPKQFGPGDLDGSGSKKLLGAPNIDQVEVLVRETAQNSWDARSSNERLSFHLNLRTLTPRQAEILKELVYVESAENLNLSTVLSRPAVRVLEISDRGTVGLNGPVRNDRSIPLGESTNFVDFVLNVGVQRESTLDGGTYGFGKTAVYSASEVGTVLICTRCETPGGIETRIIGSAIGSAYDEGELRYTGRHWWGKRSEDGMRVEPLIGPEAEKLADTLFVDGFKGSETGTSIMVLAPTLTSKGPEKDQEALASAIVNNLWPKLVKHQVGRTVMDIKLTVDGESVPLPKPEEHEELWGYVACLHAVRAAQDGVEAPSISSVWKPEVHEIQSLRPRKLLGHLALITYPQYGKQTEEPKGVTLMRNEAELVVKGFQGRRLGVDGFQWAGVFKPVKATDGSFAAAEPPAHDDWVPKGVTDPTQRSEVNVALTRIKDRVRTFTAPANHLTLSAAEPKSAAVAGDALAGLMVGVGSSVKSVKKRGRRTQGKRAEKPQAAIVGTKVVRSKREGWLRSTVSVRLSDTSSRQRVEVDVLVGTEAGSESESGLIHIVGWGGDDAPPQETVLMQPNGVREFVFEQRGDLAVDVIPKVRLGNG